MNECMDTSLFNTYSFLVVVLLWVTYSRFQSFPSNLTLNMSSVWWMSVFEIWCHSNNSLYTVGFTVPSTNAGTNPRQTLLAWLASSLKTLLSEKILTGMKARKGQCIHNSLTATWSSSAFKSLFFLCCVELGLFLTKDGVSYSLAVTQTNGNYLWLLILWLEMALQSGMQTVTEWPIHCTIINNRMQLCNRCENKIDALWMFFFFQSTVVNRQHSAVCDCFSCSCVTVVSCAPCFGNVHARVMKVK